MKQQTFSRAHTQADVEAAEFSEFITKEDLFTEVQGSSDPGLLLLFQNPYLVCC